MKKILLYLFLFSLILTGINIAHGDKKHKKNQDTVTVVNGDTIAINGVAVIDSLKSINQKTSEIKDTENEETEFNLSEALTEHIHNKLIHFPIAFSILLLLFLVIGYKVEVCYRASKIIVILGLLSSIIAAIFGLLQATPFEGKEVYELVLLHRNLGLSSIFIWVVLTWIIIKRMSWKLQFSVALTLSFLIAVIGLLGGVIAH